MNNLKGTKVYLSGITSSEAFAEASRDELKALIALAEADGQMSSVDELARVAGITKLRAAAAVALWEQAGAFTPTEDGIEYEFEADLSDSRDGEEAKEVALSLRNVKLKELIAEIGQLMGRAALNTTELKRITALVTQLALSEEYVLTLAAHLEEKGKLTVLKLYRLAEELSASGVDTAEDLQIWIQEKDNKPLSHHKEFCRGMDYRIRPLTRTEKEYAERWVINFGYGEAVISEAVNIATVNTEGKKPLSYIDRLLEAWHGAGCKTVAECIAKYKADKPKTADKTPKSHTQKKSSDSPKFSDFNADDALMRALERSYGKSEDSK